MRARHYPEPGDIWKCTYHPDLYYKPQHKIEEHYLVYEAKLDSALVFSFEDGTVRRAIIQDWFTTASLKWEKLG